VLQFTQPFSSAEWPPGQGSQTQFTTGQFSGGVDHKTTIPLLSETDESLFQHCTPIDAEYMSFPSPSTWPGVLNIAYPEVGRFDLSHVVPSVSFSLVWP
jgi:hypothetical protein